jgi:hypothetical protein
MIYLEFESRGVCVPWFAVVRNRESCPCSILVRGLTGWSTGWLICGLAGVVRVPRRVGMVRGGLLSDGSRWYVRYGIRVRRGWRCECVVSGVWFIRCHG